MQIEAQQVEQLREARRILRHAQREGAQVGAALDLLLVEVADEASTPPATQADSNGAHVADLRDNHQALSYALEPLDADALRSAVRRVTNGSVGGEHTRALSKSTLVVMLHDLVTDRFFNSESPESVDT